jgi:hypothetical protein
VRSEKERVVEDGFDTPESTFGLLLDFLSGVLIFADILLHG